MVKLTKKNVRILETILVFTMAILIIAAPVVAQGPTLNLPPNPVDVIVQNDTTSYFVTTLSNVPGGYDVTNGPYSGWCIDHNITMTRNETFVALLYSSLNPPPGNYSDIQWDKVNYILNNKLANFTETQDAIWNFVNNTSTNFQSLDPNETALVNASYEYGTGFVPSPGQSVAVIVFPQSSGSFQDSIIEATMPQPLTVNATVTGSATLIGDNTYQMDQGATAYFAANAQGGIQPYSYTWYVNDTANTTNQTMTFTAQQTGTYIIYANATDSSNPPQNASSANYTVNVTIPEYPLLAIGLLAASLPVTLLTRRKKSKIV
ncbi:MAG: hypothetical protein ABSB89_10915 [Candidatus Bathyarchaeia archaeon]|jgi:hypothetical protein